MFNYYIYKVTDKVTGQFYIGSQCKGNKSWLGKHHSEEWKRKRSEALKGHIVSEEIRKKISNAKKGQVTWNKGKINVYSKDTIEKMRIARIGKSHIVSDETKQKISRANKGRRHTVEEIEKMRGIRKDKKCIICVETDIIYKSIREAEHILNINHSSILRCCQGKQHLAGGYHWKYFEVGK